MDTWQNQKDKKELQAHRADQGHTVWKLRALHLLAALEGGLKQSKIINVNDDDNLELARKSRFIFSKLLKKEAVHVKLFQWIYPT